MAYDKVVDSTVLDGYFSDIADAIRDKDGTQNSYTPAQMPQAIEDIPTGSDEDYIACIERSGNSIVIPAGTTIIGDYAFYGAAADKSPGEEAPCVIPAGVSRINDFAFSTSSITSLKSESGSLANIDGYAFKGCSSLTDVDLSASTLLRAIDVYCFNLCGALARVKLPTSINKLYQDVFKGCSALTTITGLDNLSEAQYEAFSGCSALTALKLPALTTVGGSVCYGCSAMTLCDLGNSALSGITIGDQMWRRCSALASVVLRYNTACALPGTNVFDRTLIASGTGYIYVPRDLIATYEAATNWTTYAGQFRAIEDYTADGTIDGDFIPPAN